ncbi:hypothetical protein [Streptomyces sp. NPDC091209]|uniref:hypothetical protein n=1 Tax=Streptomyces sp. NPDC091209 TaxID=3365974 RepID=UPI0037FE3074
MNAPPDTDPSLTTEGEPTRVRAGEPAGPGGPPHWAEQLTTVLREFLPTPEGVPGTDDLRRAGLSAIHRWQARTVLPLLTRAEPDGGPVAEPGDGAGAEPGAECPSPPLPTERLIGLHLRAARGDTADEPAWATALHPVLLDTYRRAYPHAAAYAEAHANARDYALANGRSPAEADDYGHAYARLSTAANAESFATAHADALTPALAHVYATADPDAYTETFPGSQARAAAHACAPAGRPPDPAVFRHLTEGLGAALTDTSV